MTTAHATKFDSQAVHTRSTGPFSGQLKVESQFCPSDVADPMAVSYTHLTLPTKA